MRLIHTADIHLDASFATPGMPAGFGGRRRQALRDVFRSVLHHARKQGADAVLIAGDLFDEERASADTLAFVRAEFTALGDIPVYIAPGNHDPYTAKSSYATTTWPANVRIFTEPRWTAFEEAGAPLTVHGFAFDGPEISTNPYGRLEIARENGRIHVGVAHGSEMSCVSTEMGAYAPFRAADAAVDGLLYLALGHYHAMRGIETPNGTLMYYSGTPEGHSFGEAGPRHFLQIDIDDDRRVTVTPILSSRHVYETHEIDCSPFASAQDVVDAIRALPGPQAEGRIARIRLRGSCAEAWQGELQRIYEAVAPQFDFLDLVDALEPAEDLDALAREQSSLGAFVRRLRDEIRFAVDEDEAARLRRALETGVAAFRGRTLPIRGADRG